MALSLSEQLIVLFSGGGMGSAFFIWVGKKLSRYGQRFLDLVDTLEDYTKHEKANRTKHEEHIRDTTRMLNILENRD